MGAKEDWTNGKPTEEQQQDFIRLKAVHHSCLTFKAPRKSMDTTIQDSILADEMIPQAINCLVLEKMD
jgi:hypothetical protein